MRLARLAGGSVMMIIEQNWWFSGGVGKDSWGSEINGVQVHEVEVDAQRRLVISRLTRIFWGHK